MKPLSTLLSAAVLLAAASFAADSAKAQQTQPPNGASVSNGAANGYNVPPQSAPGWRLLADAQRYLGTGGDAARAEGFRAAFRLSA